MRLTGIRGIRDVDREILMKLDDYSLLKTCSLNNFRKSVCDDSFLERRLRETYFETLKYKPENKSWKQYFLEVIYYMDKLSFYDENGDKVVPKKVGDLKSLYIYQFKERQMTKKFVQKLRRL